MPQDDKKKEGRVQPRFPGGIPVDPIRQFMGSPFDFVNYAKQGQFNQLLRMAYTQRLDDYAPGNRGGAIPSSGGEEGIIADEFTKSFSTDMLMRNNVVDRFDVDWFHKFSRTGFIDPFNDFTRTTEYLFFTKPDLNLTGEDAGTTCSNPADKVSSFFQDALDRYPEVAEMLQYSKNTRMPFAPLLSNAVTGSLDLPGISADSIETAKNVFGTFISYRGTSMKSDQDYDFSLDFRDDKYLDVYMYFKMYDEYEKLKWSGLVGPKSVYRLAKVVHDQTSIFKFIVDADGMSVRYFAWVVGVYPVSVPRDSMSNIGTDTNFSVNFKAQFAEDLNPRIIWAFNRAAASGARGISTGYPLFDLSEKLADGDWATMPFIKERPGGTNKGSRDKYYLQWVR